MEIEASSSYYMTMESTDEANYDRGDSDYEPFQESDKR